MNKKKNTSMCVDNTPFDDYWNAAFELNLDYEQEEE